MHLAWQLGITDTDGCCFCKDGILAGRPVADIGNKDELEWLVGVVNLEPARRIGWNFRGSARCAYTQVGKRKLKANKPRSSLT